MRRRAYILRLSRWIARSSRGEETGRRSVVVWDVSRTGRLPTILEPYAAALRVRDIGEAFGRVVEACAFVEPRVSLTDQRPRTWAEERLVEWELRPEWHTERPGTEIGTYSCSYCGRNMKSHRTLVLHFKEVHAKEHGKRLHRLNSIKNVERKRMYKQAMADQERRLQAAGREILMPRALVNDELCSALTRAGYLVRLCIEKPYRDLCLTSAEHAIVNTIWHAVNHGVACLCLVSDSPRFAEFVGVARQCGLRVVGVGSGRSQVLCSGLDLYINWGDVASGYAQIIASEAARLWFPAWPKPCQQPVGGAVLLRECTDADYEAVGGAVLLRECTDADYEAVDDE